MREEGIWQTLGLAPTADTREIRRAYAQRLKSLDVDRDPEAYADLRHARDMALHWAAHPPEDEPAFASEPGSASLAFDTDSLSPAEPLPLDAAQPEEEAEHPFEKLYTDRVSLLSADEDTPPLDDAGEARLDQLFALLRTDPRLDEIGYFGNASEWFAETIARSWPRSARLALPAATFFAWEGHSEIHRSPAVDWVLHRIDAARYGDSLDDPAHPLHDAWNELRTPTTSRSKRGKVPEPQVTQLLDIIRSHYPELEQRLDWHRVSLWEEAPKKSWKSWRGLAAWIGIVLLTQAVRFCDYSSTPPPSQPSSNIPLSLTVQDGQLENARADVGRLLRDSLHGQVTIAQLDDRDPQLVSQLIEDWNIAKNNGSALQDYLVVGRSILLTRIRQNLTKASSQTLVDHFRLLLAQGEAIAAVDQAKCGDFFKGVDTGFEWPADLANRRQALFQSILLEAPLAGTAVDEPPKASFRIPAALAKRTWTAIGISEQQFAAAMVDEGDKAIRCRAQLGLLRTTLALPDNERFQLMRAMVGGKAD